MKLARKELCRLSLRQGAGWPSPSELSRSPEGLAMVPWGRSQGS